MSAREHLYRASLRWTGNRGQGTSSYTAFGRDLEASVTGRTPAPGNLPMSSDPAFRGDASRYNPEDLLLLSLSSCHMLWYLHLAAEHGILVQDYVDDCEAVLADEGRSGGQFVRAVLRPRMKNSADIRMVVDALDLCYTKPHVDTFAIVSGDSDFSPLVSKLRENNKTVIGVGVKQSTSGLFIDNCVEFILYDDLVREEEKTKKRIARAKPAPSTVKPTTNQERKPGGDPEKAIQLVVETVEAMLGRSGSDTVWAGPVKQAIRRRQPQFDERFYGFSTFSALLEAAAERGLMKLEKNENGYRIKVSASEE